MCVCVCVCIPAPNGFYSCWVSAAGPQITESCGGPQLWDRHFTILHPPPAVAARFHFFSLDIPYPRTRGQKVPKTPQSNRGVDKKKRQKGVCVCVCVGGGVVKGKERCWMSSRLLRLHFGVLPIRVWISSPVDLWNGAGKAGRINNTPVHRLLERGSEGSVRCRSPPGCILSVCLSRQQGREEIVVCLNNGEKKRNSS